MAVMLLGAAASLNAYAKEVDAAYPSRPIRLVIGFPPGGATDTLARLFAHHLSEKLGQKIIVEHRPGAAGNVAAEFVSRASPDGYTLYLTARPNTIHKAMYGYLNFDVTQDFSAIGLLATSHSVIVAGKDGPIGSVRDLITLAKAHPGSLTCASPGVGADGYLLCELFKQETGTDIIHVPYRGAAPAFVDLIGGRVDVLFTSLSSALPHISSGAVRAIAVTSRQRAPIDTRIPTSYETGLPGLDLLTWYGLAAPAGTPREVVDRLSDSINALLMDPAVQRGLGERAYTVPLPPNTPDTFQALISAEAERWTTFLKAQGIRPAY